MSSGRGLERAPDGSPSCLSCSAALYAYLLLANCLIVSPIQQRSSGQRASNWQLYYLEAARSSAVYFVPYPGLLRQILQALSRP